MADSALSRRRSSWLTWAGTGLFWSLVLTIVLARAVFFEPGIFNAFERAVAFAQALLVLL